MYIKLSVIFWLCLQQCAATSAFFNFKNSGFGFSIYSGFENFWCKISGRECCSEPHINRDHNVMKSLESELSKHLYGQHIAASTAVNAISSHLKRALPKKALVLSFHGWTGSGKNYLVNFIAEALYQKGVKSKYFHHFYGPLHFPLEEMQDIYKLHIQDWIRGNVSVCPYQLFVFDEVDVVHPGVIDAVKPFADYHEHIDGVDYRQCIFVFLSNVGGKEIAKVAYKFWESGKPRSDLRYQHFEHIVSSDAYNEHGGFQHSRLLSSHVIDYYIPFLPLEKSHVRGCIKDEFDNIGYDYTDKHVEGVLELLTFIPDDVHIFSKTGCKTVQSRVDLYLDGD